MITPNLNTTIQDDPVAARHIEVGVLLANQLDVMLTRYKTRDGKTLTEGEVMQAIGNLIGSHSKDRERVEVWLRHVAHVAFIQQLTKASSK